MSPETPPHNAEAERVVIGALLVDPDALPLAAASLRAEDFYLSGLRYAFSAARSLRARGDKLDTVTLRDELIRVGGLDAIGGTAGVASLVDGMPRITNLEDWCRIVSRDARRRRALDALAQARQHVLEDADAGIGSALQALIATASTAGGHAPKTIAERMADLDLAVYQRLDAPGGIIGLRTGLADIDYLLGGLQGGALTIIAHPYWSQLTVRDMLGLRGPVGPAGDEGG